MANLTVTPKLVRPLPGALIRNFTAGASLNVGDLVYVDSNGYVQQADGSAAGTSRAIGVVVSAGTLGETTASTGDVVSVVYVGPVCGFGGATPGGRLYVSDDAGRIADAAGTNVRVVGIALTSDTLMLLPNFAAS